MTIKSNKATKFVLFDFNYVTHPYLEYFNFSLSMVQAIHSFVCKIHALAL